MFFALSIVTGRRPHEKSTMETANATAVTKKMRQIWPHVPLSARFFSSIVVLSGCFALGCLAQGCDRPDPPPKPLAPKTTEPRLPEPVPPSPKAEPPPEPTAEIPDPPHPGPWLWVTRLSAGIYSKPDDDKALKFAYVKRGGRLPVEKERVEGKGCPKGWLKVTTGGYICNLVGTMNESDKEARFPPRQPKLDEVLPFLYVRNAFHGTPLYKSMPTRQKMCEYEPYACKEDKKPEPKPGEAEAAPAKDATQTAKQEAPLPAENTVSAQAASMAELAGSGSESSAARAALEAADPDAALPEVEAKPWEDEESLHELKQDSLVVENDPFVARYMLKGFYVAVDKTFTWLGRTWYKTTKGLIAPADRMWASPGPTFQGVEVDGEKLKLPLAFVYGARKSATIYAIDPTTKRLTVKAAAKKWQALQLTGKTETIANKEYLELGDGTWVRAGEVRKTTPSARPAEVGETERWIDVDISEQTLIAFQGDQAVYATLISSGKESKIAEKDHSTPRGIFRVREKHVVTTMDGDGTAAGDLPYSIEDVPYVMFFHKAYATHGAFWHQNYGSQMSHGCVNLAPLDAKWVFFFAEPQMHQGYSGTWSSGEHPGSAVVVHD
jgi:lipoprotein-anchoring transpeptidase ErfK/SrfK